MSAVTAMRTAAAGPRSRLDAYRDDGPLALALGRALGPLVGVPAPALTVVSVLPLIVAVAIGGDVLGATLPAATAWCVLVGGVASGRPDTGRFGWAVSPLLRMIEYGTLLAFAVLAGPEVVPFCFALVAVLAFHHYDTVYRLRHQGVAPPVWLSLAGGGWDGRLALACAGLLLGALGPGMLVAAVVLALVYVIESAVGWRRFAQAERPPAYDDEEEEDD